MDTSPYWNINVTLQTDHLSFILLMSSFMSLFHYIFLKEHKKKWNVSMSEGLLPKVNKMNVHSMLQRGNLRIKQFWMEDKLMYFIRQNNFSEIKKLFLFGRETPGQ